jgi:hypothetical protein
VHEKGILVPLLPLNLYFGLQEPTIMCWVNLIAVFSMVPLLKKDELGLGTMGALVCSQAAIQLTVLLATRFAGSHSKPGTRIPMRLIQPSCSVSLAGCVAILLASAMLAPPSSLPYLYDALTVTWSFLHFAALYCYTQWLQYIEFLRAKPSIKLKHA